MRNKILWGLLGVALVVLGYHYASAGTPVETVAASRGDIRLAVVDTGYVQALDQADIYALQGGRVASLPVSVGQMVQKGQVMMVLDNKDLSMGTAQLQVQLSQAAAAASAAEAALKQGNLDMADIQAQFERVRELFAAGAISQVDYDTAGSQLEKTRAGIEAQEQALRAAREQVGNFQSLLSSSRQKESELQARSPISGIVLQLPVRQDEVVMSGSLVAKVAPPGALEIRVDILSDDLGGVRLGNRAEVTAPVLGTQVLTGEVAKIYPQAEEKQSALGVVQRRVPTIIRLDEPGNLRPGYETRVSVITGGKQNIILIPRESVSTSPDGSKQVLLIVENRTVVRKVSTGIYDARNIEITGGLEVGDQIIKDGTAVLKPNARVRLKQP